MKLLQPVHFQPFLILFLYYRKIETYTQTSLNGFQNDFTIFFCLSVSSVILTIFQWEFPEFSKSFLDVCIFFFFQIEMTKLELTFNILLILMYFVSFHCSFYITLILCLARSFFVPVSFEHHDLSFSQTEIAIPLILLLCRLFIPCKLNLIIMKSLKRKVYFYF